MSIPIHPGHGSAYSYFDLARQYGVDYGDVLNAADGLEAQSRGEQPRCWFEPAFDRLFRHPHAHSIFASLKVMVAATREIFRR